LLPAPLAFAQDKPASAEQEKAATTEQTPAAGDSDEAKGGNRIVVCSGVSDHCGVCCYLKVLALRARLAEGTAVRPNYKSVLRLDTQFWGDTNSQAASQARREDQYEVCYRFIQD
jgi:hypothetical protein